MVMVPMAWMAPPLLVALLIAIAGRRGSVHRMVRESA